MNKGRYQEFRDALASRVLVLDGSLGVQIGRMLATGGGNVDFLNITSPDTVARVHHDYLAAGSDIIETNTFNSNRLSQSVYALQDRVRELNIRGAEIAREQASAFEKREPGRIRFVAGSIGPTAASASLPNNVDNAAGHAVDFDTLQRDAAEQAGALIDGGVDLLLLETCFDALNIKAQQQLKEEFPELADLSSTKNVNLKEYINFEKATVRGFEVSLSGNPFAGFTLNGNYTYAYARGKGEEGWQNIQRSIRHTATISGNYAHSWGDYTMNLNLNGRLQSKCYYPGDADGDAPGYGIWNLNTRHSFDCFSSFFLEPGIGIDNIFNKRDMRPLTKNFTLYSPGRMLVVSLTLKLKN